MYMKASVATNKIVNTTLQLHNMYMKASVVSVLKFYDAKIYKNIYKNMHILSIFSRFFFV
jgi:hypothetical protein